MVMTLAGAGHAERPIVERVEYSPQEEVREEEEHPGGNLEKQESTDARVRKSSVVQET